VVEISDNGLVWMKQRSVNYLNLILLPSQGQWIGLTNTQNIILNHRGTINVESKPGKGTTFIIKFNFADAN